MSLPQPANRQQAAVLRLIGFCEPTGIFPRLSPGDGPDSVQLPAAGSKPSSSTQRHRPVESARRAWRSGVKSRAADDSSFPSRLSQEQLHIFPRDRVSPRVVVDGDWPDAGGPVVGGELEGRMIDLE